MPCPRHPAQEGWKPRIPCPAPGSPGPPHLGSCRALREAPADRLFLMPLTVNLHKVAPLWGLGVERSAPGRWWGLATRWRW